jgi:hypothetical protein
MNKLRLSIISINILFLVGIQQLSPADDTLISENRSRLKMSGSPIKYDFDEKNQEYEESQLRRFETVFFISLPAGVIFSLLGVLAFRGATGLTGPFTPMEYQYVFLSAVGISVSIAFHDNRVTYKKEVFD